MKLYRWVWPSITVWQSREELLRQVRTIALRRGPITPAALDTAIGKMILDGLIVHKEVRDAR